MDRLVDELSTRQKARQLLKRYERIKRLANQDNQSAANLTIGNIQQAMKLLSVKSANLLYLTYMDKIKWTGYELAEKFGVSVSTIEKWKAVALIEFSEAYNAGDLQIYME